MAKKSILIRNIRRGKRRPVQHRNRCAICGRPRGYYRFFNLCRICLREYALRGYLPGVTKSSW